MPQESFVYRRWILPIFFICASVYAFYLTRNLISITFRLYYPYQMILYVCLSNIAMLAGYARKNREEFPLKISGLLILWTILALVIFFVLTLIRFTEEPNSFAIVSCEIFVVSVMSFILPDILMGMRTTATVVGFFSGASVVFGTNYYIYNMFKDIAVFPNHYLLLLALYTLIGGIFSAFCSLVLNSFILQRNIRFPISRGRRSIVIIIAVIISIACVLSLSDLNFLVSETAFLELPALAVGLILLVFGVKAGYYVLALVTSAYSIYLVMYGIQNHGDAGWKINVLVGIAIWLFLLFLWLILRKDWSLARD